MTEADVAAALGAALALSAEGRKCFPCSLSKRPTTPHGFFDAQNNPGLLQKLWRLHPALDLDAKHPEAAEWWLQNRHRVPRTLAHRTRAGGLHLIFRHQPGVRCWAGRPEPGIDGRADGGYIIWWPSAGLPVLCDASPAPWPAWLLDELNPPWSEAGGGAWAPPADLSRYRAASRYASAALRHSADRVALASLGSRNRALNDETYGIGRLVAEGLLDAQEVADTLAAAAFDAGLGPREIEATLRSAFRARGLL